MFLIFSDFHLSLSTVMPGLKVTHCATIEHWRCLTLLSIYPYLSTVMPGLKVTHCASIEHWSSSTLLGIYPYLSTVMPGLKVTHCASIEHWRCSTRLSNKKYLCTSNADHVHKACILKSWLYCNNRARSII